MNIETRYPNIITGEDNERILSGKLWKAACDDARVGVPETSANYDGSLKRALFIEQSSYPPNHYVRKVPQRKLHMFTMCQLLQLGIVAFFGLAPWYYLKMIFPVLILLLLPVRWAFGENGRIEKKSATDLYCLQAQDSDQTDRTEVLGYIGFALSVGFALRYTEDADPLLSMSRWSRTLRPALTLLYTWQCCFLTGHAAVLFYLLYWQLSSYLLF